MLSTLCFGNETFESLHVFNESIRETFGFEFFWIDGQWDARCEEVGLAGYGNKDLNIVRENVFDAIKFTLDTDDIEFLERIISIEEIG